MILRHLMSMLHRDDGEEVGQVEGHSGAVATAAVQQDVSYRSPVRNRITGSLGAQDGKVVDQRAARIEEAQVQVAAVVVAVPVVVADSGELRAARVVRGRSGTVCAGHALRRAHLR